ncbi:uncharacterized protein LOC117105398, partial [Anneissia japonica]|uniref:uncharacterized protein LOC117105398 n=1 Tax=Anneissia japonica TaxID=1529436 RepID=UPI001425AB98
DEYLNSTIDTPNDGTLERRKRNAPHGKLRVCSSEHLYVAYSTGFKASYIKEPVAIIAQGHIIQKIEEDVCNPDESCFFLNDCMCNNEERLAHVIVITRDGFISSTVKVRACVARRQ